MAGPYHTLYTTAVIALFAILTLSILSDAADTEIWNDETVNDTITQTNTSLNVCMGDICDTSYQVSISYNLSINGSGACTPDNGLCPTGNISIGANGTQYYIAKFLNETTIGNSSMRDNGTNMTITLADNGGGFTIGNSTDKYLIVNPFSPGNVGGQYPAPYVNIPGGLSIGNAYTKLGGVPALSVMHKFTEPTGAVGFQMNPSADYGVTKGGLTGLNVNAITALFSTNDFSTVSNNNQAFITLGSGTVDLWNGIGTNVGALVGPITTARHYITTPGTWSHPTKPEAVYGYFNDGDQNATLAYGFYNNGTEITTGKRWGFYSNGVDENHFGGNTTFGEDLNVTGNITGNLHYGEMYAHNDTGFTINITDGSNYFNITNMTAGNLNGFTFSNNQTLTVPLNGLYATSYSISFGNGGANTEYQMSVLVDNIVQEDCETHRMVGTAGDVGNSGGHCLLTLNVGDALELGIKEIGGAINDPDVFSANLNLYRIGS